ncbi:PQQ-dependent sugar dehydrogenase [Geodermatophilus aquaeductus]|uniref:Glucose/arabinose dehydrogenase, beta-propeller fold n=1 Tax=Geodermatophilus aquaeductus TaxID=1564161 RepID=A0A521AHZ0_9ACTN|nr:PA14 domain-containing protein [Geodermatophilus aquaeductus]SMO34432.1 Glucose/arabinose dehydrogenase, beta-propeller fold [Geodermatophilus aquaeductus]
MALGMRQLRRTAHATAVGAAALLLVVAACLAVVLPTATPAAAAPQPGFSDTTAFSGLVNPTAVRFAPDGRVFVAEKRGTVQMFDGLGDSTPTRIADLRTEVHNFWDRGLLGLAVDPGFPARPYLYALYTFDGPVGGTAPRWGTAGADSDPCPNPPGATSDGCVVSAKLVKLTLTGTATTKQDLVHDWCQQYPSHSIGDLVFGRDGALYASGGDGASFDFADYGQDGNPVNPCGDPPGGVGGAMTPPTAQGGALRSQDLLTTGDPVTLDGTVIRVSPDTGAALPDNPNAASADANARRIVAFGLRNPFRLTQRPGTDEIWIGDVGWGSWEELDRLVTPTARPTNFGWPCYEGDGRQGAYDGLDLTVCEDLYAQGAGAVTAPYFPYRHGQPLNANDNCRVTAGSSSSGLSFSFYAGGPYPAEYDGALFFSDYSRNCIWVMTRGTDGLPDRLKARPFVTDAAGPVDLEISPQGELFYADLNGGTVRRVVYGGTTPTPTTCPQGQYLAEYFPNRTLTGAPAVTACEPPPLSHDWGAGAPAGVGPDNFSARWTGTFDFGAGGNTTFTAVSDDGIRVAVDGTTLIDQWQDQSATTFTGTRQLTAGVHQVRVEWFETGGDAVAKLSWATTATPAGDPVPQIATPAAGTTWQVGETISFTGSATDGAGQPLPATALTWQMVLRHCPDACHDHPLQSWTGVSGASIAAPDHEYPAHLALQLTARDAAGRTATVTRELQPRTVPVTVATQPAGLQVTLGSRTAATPFTATLIVGATTSLTAVSPQTSAGVVQEFVSWSDGGAQTHQVTAGTAAVTYTATYRTTCAAGQYRAQYFANRTLSGTPASTGCEAAPLDRNWGTGAAPGTGQNNFSARWTGVFSFTAGAHVLTATGDEGIRVYVDGVLRIDRWAAGGTGSWTLDQLQAGTHEIRVEYFEKTGTASARVTWT